MSTLDRLRHDRRLPALVLAGFVLALAMSLFASVRAASAFDWVCTTGGMKLVSIDGEADTRATSMHPGECPLCSTPGHPPPAAPAESPRVRALGHVLQPLVAAHIAWITAAPLPARGPPALSI